MMIDQTLLEDAISRMQRLVANEPDVGQFQVVEDQLRYLLDYVQGKNDGERLPKVDFDLINLREVEPRDPETGKVLDEISAGLLMLRRKLRRLATKRP
jgi:hypothetical protein